MAWIPKSLQALFRGKPIKSQLLTGTPASEAAAVKRAMRVKDDQLFAELKALSPERKAEIIAAGGYDAYLRQKEAEAVRERKRVAELISDQEEDVPEDLLLAPAEEIEHEFFPHVVILPPGDGAPRRAADLPEWTRERFDLSRLKTLQQQRARAAEIEAAKAALPLVAQAAPGFTINDLFEQWKARMQPKRPRDTARAAKHLTAYLEATGGPADYRDVKREHLDDFPQWQVDQGVAVVSAHKAPRLRRGHVLRRNAEACEGQPGARGSEAA